MPRNAPLGGITTLRAESRYEVDLTLVPAPLEAEQPVEAEETKAQDTGLPQTSRSEGDGSTPAVVVKMEPTGNGDGDVTMGEATARDPKVHACCSHGGVTSAERGKDIISLQGSSTFEHSLCLS